MKFEFNPFPELQSSRLLLRKLTLEDSKLLFDYMSDKQNFPFVDMPEHDSQTETIDYIQKMNSGVNDNKWIIWAICDKESNSFIGTISIWNFNTEENKAELGYGLFSHGRGKGFMTETLRLVLDYGFSELQFDSIEAYTNIENQKSTALLDRLDFNYITQVKEGKLILGVYSIKKEKYLEGVSKHDRV